MGSGFIIDFLTPRTSRPCRRVESIGVNIPSWFVEVTGDDTEAKQQPVGERSLPAREGDVWRMDFSRFQWIEEGGTRVCPGWAWTSHETYDSHIPDRFSVIHFSEKVVGEEGAGD